MNFVQQFKSNSTLDNFYRVFLLDQSIAQTLYEENTNNFLNSSATNLLEFACQKHNLKFLKFLNQFSLADHWFSCPVIVNEKEYPSVSSYMWLKWVEGWKVLETNMLFDNINEYFLGLRGNIENICQRGFYHVDEDNTQALYNLIDHFIIPNQENQKHKYYLTIDEMLHSALRSFSGESISDILSNDTPYDQELLFTNFITTVLENDSILTMQGKYMFDKLHMDFDFCYKLLEEILELNKIYNDCNDFLGDLKKFKENNPVISVHVQDDPETSIFIKKIQIRIEAESLKNGTAQNQQNKKKVIL